MELLDEIIRKIQEDKRSDSVIAEETGISRCMITQIKQGKRAPGAKNFEKLLFFYGIVKKRSGNGKNYYY